MEFESTHKLDFEVADWQYDGQYKRFRIGTCDGLWGSIETSYGILAVSNSSPGNGHFTDVLEWFENSCKRDNKSLQILEVWNKRLKKHLIEKCGFVDIGNNHVEKVFSKK